jgi:glycosyltransferase involved in cell wall biosynthesis
MEYKKGKLFIVDDVFTHPRSVDSWRGVEFHSYLDNFFEAQIITSLASIKLLNSMAEDEIMREYQQKYPQYKNRVSALSENEFLCLQDADMAYFIFLNNVWSSLDAIEKYKTPFIFQLYPGGGLALNNIESDRKLREVMQSYYFRGVIVSSIVIYQYLIEYGFCHKEQILLLPGCVMNNQVWKDAAIDKRYYGKDKDCFDIAFASYRYSKYGEDKGYDVFVKAAQTLHKISDKFKFHVIGNYDEKILDVSNLGDAIKFYGVRDVNWFNAFYQDIDVFLSPNKSSILDGGSFDGFPTGCGMDALIRKVVLIATDDLEQNNGQYCNGMDIFIVKNNLQIIMDRIMFLFQHPYMLKRYGECGFKKAKELYSYERQIRPRIQFINSILKQNI